MQASEQSRVLRLSSLGGGAQVVCATCTGAGDEKRLHGMRFRQVVIDEATQATEPSVLIPLVRVPCCALSSCSSTFVRSGRPLPG